MAKDFAKQFYNSKQWHITRDRYIKKRIMVDGGLCEICKKNLGYIVHHKIPITEKNINNLDITINHKNLSYECKSCHDLHDGHGLNKKKNGFCVFDENGQPKPIDY